MPERRNAAHDWPYGRAARTCSQLPPPNDRLTWRLVTGQRCAQAVLRVLEGLGLELRISIDGELRWSRLYRGAGLEESALDMRRAFQQRDWKTAPVE